MAGFVERTRAFDGNLVVRAVVDTDPKAKPLLLGQDDALRVLRDLRSNRA